MALGTGPMATFVVPHAWVDYNGHMNDAAYAIAFSRTVDRFMDAIGLDAAGRAESGRTVFTASALVRYLAEVKLEAELSVALRVLELNDKRAHVWMTMTRAADGSVAALGEQVLACVDHRAMPPRGAAWPTSVRARIDGFAWPMGEPRPTLAGRGLTLSRHELS